MSLKAPWTTRSRMVGIERTRTPFPFSFGIALCRNRMGRYVRMTSASWRCWRNISTPSASMASNVTPSIPGAPLFSLASRYASRSVSSLQTWTYRPQKRQAGSAFALAYILRRRSCRLMGVFVIAPLPPMLSKALQTVGSLRSTGITPLHHYYGPLRHPLIFSRFPGVSGYTTYLAPPFSRWDAEGFSSCLACPCAHAVAPTPPEWSAASASVRRPMLPSPFRLQARPLGLLTFGATNAFACATAWKLAPIPQMVWSRGFRKLVSRPPALRATGLWLFPWEVSLLLNTLAFPGHTSGRSLFNESGSLRSSSLVSMVEECLDGAVGDSPHIE